GLTGILDFYIDSYLALNQQESKYSVSILENAVSYSFQLSVNTSFLKLEFLLLTLSFSVVIYKKRLKRK
ncbi:MAG: hypothetical protein ACW967_03425, partial [Candidatus Hodarchaeales archaeon]